MNETESEKEAGGLKPKAEKKAESKEVKKAAQSSKSVKPATSPPKGSGGLMPVEELGEKAGIKTWEVAGLMRAAGWAPGKQVTKEEFDLTLDRFRKRPQGGGRI